MTRKQVKEKTISIIWEALYQNGPKDVDYDITDSPLGVLVEIKDALNLTAEEIEANNK